jgi:uncharacterized protein YbaP (TraB family)
MNLRTLQLLLVFLIFVVAIPAHSASPVWKITKGDKQLFIGGTIHLLTQDDYPLPPSFEEAYSQSVLLVLETDIQKLQGPEFQQTLVRELTYPNGQSLQQVLSKETYQSLEDYCSRRGFPVANIVKFKPGMVSMLLTIIELQRLGLVGTGVDEFYSLKATNDMKGLAHLETISEQLAYISTMGEGREDEMIAYTLQENEVLSEVMQALKEAWRQGDTLMLEKIALTSAMGEFPKIYDSLIAKRNNAWVPQIEAMLETNEVEFVLVGALHLVGDKGVLAQLSARGCNIQML